MWIYTGMLLSFSPSLCHTFTVLYFYFMLCCCRIRSQMQKRLVLGSSWCSHKSDPKDVDPNACPRWPEAFVKLWYLLVRLLVGVKRAWISITFFSYDVVVLYFFVKLNIMDASYQSAMIHCLIGQNKSPDC